MGRPERRDEEGGESPSLVRHEEQLKTSTRTLEDRSVRMRTTVEKMRVDESVPRLVQHAEIQRVPPNHEDSGQIETLKDGSISIPVLEEQIVVTKRTVVRERIIVHRREESEVVPVHEELRREHVEIEGDPDLIVDDGTAGGTRHQGYTAPLPGSTNAPKR